VTELAAFASSEAGRAYARTEQFWGRDPAAFLEPIDDVLAHNLRAALLVALVEEPTEDAEEQSSDEVALEHAEAVERTRAGGERIRELMRG
jgi:hypothetical protein